MKNTASRIVALLLAITLCCGMLPVAAFATGTPMKIVVDSVNAQPGGEVKVAVKVEDNPGIASMKLVINFDSVLTLTAVEYNTAVWQGMAQAPQNFKNPVTLNWFDGTKNFTESEAVFATLTFQVADDAEEDTTANITVSFDEEDIYNIAEENVECTIVDGVVTICSLVPGDINGDRQRNNKDITRMFQYLANWDVKVVEQALDTNNDGNVNNKDMTRLFQFLANWDVELWCNGVLLQKCQHDLEEVPYKAPKCEEEGNARYYRCSECGKLFSNENATAEITIGQTVLKATGHKIVTIPAVDPDYGVAGSTEGRQCSVCKWYEVEPQPLEPLEENIFKITYNLEGTDDYLKRYFEKNDPATINPNPSEFNTTYEDQELADIDDNAVPGYKFERWVNSRDEEVRIIEQGKTGSIELTAVLTPIEYEINYNVYGTPVAPITDQDYRSYTVRGGQDLPNPKSDNYVFLGWYTNDGREVTSIPVGTTGDFELNAYVTSKRNLTKAVKSLEDPFVIENKDTGVIYFTYEIGTIENVPLSDEAIWTTQNVAGLAQQKSVTVTTQISKEYTSEITKMISETTVDSATWTLSKDWTDVIEVSASWAQEHGISQAEALERMKTSTGSYSFTSSTGGCETTTDTDGITTVDYASRNVISGDSAEINAKISAGYSNEEAITKKLTGSYSLNAEVGGNLKVHNETNEHTGTDTTTVDTKVHTDNSSWNNTSTSSTTNTDSEIQAVNKEISKIISNTKGYGKSYSEGGQNSQAYDSSSSESKSVNSSSTLTFFSSEITTTTSTYSSDGKSDGWYRLVLAGKIHVFAVVEYDIATKSFFTYTFNVLDDKVYEFLDYSPSNSFDDCENGALPFEVPYFVYEYVAAKTVETEGLEFKTNTANKTAVVNGYNGTSADVIIPSYISSEDTAYKVVGIEAAAFAGKPIRSVILSDNITEIPEGAFKNCTELKQISGRFTKIGKEAFSGCTSLEQFSVSPMTTYIGKDAFKNVPQLKVVAVDKEYALEAAAKVKAENPDKDEKTVAREITQDLIHNAVNSGAQSVVMDISRIISGTVLNFNIPRIKRFELQGKTNASYPGMTIESAAETTKLRALNIPECDGMTLDIASKELILDAVSVTTSGIALVLTEDGATLSLVRDSNLTAGSGLAVVCKNPKINSVVSGSAVGTLDVSGSFYYCGTAPNSTYITISNGEMKDITLGEFEKYKDGFALVTFDPGEGSLTESEKTMTAYYNQPYGKLPVPTRTGYIFDGWFTAASGGTQVTSDTVSTTVANHTLYAHWSAMAYTVSWDTGTGYTIQVTRTESPYANAATGTLNSGDTIYYGDVLSVAYVKDDYYTITNHGEETIVVEGAVTASEIYAVAELNPLSDWVLISDMPSDATVEAQKWTYSQTLYETSTSSSMDGWTLVDSSYTWSEWGEWSTWSSTSVSPADDTQVDTRTAYHYYYYKCENCGAHMHGYGPCYTWAGGCGGTIKQSSYTPYRDAVPYSKTSDFHGTGVNYSDSTTEGRGFAYVNSSSAHYRAPQEQYRYCNRTQIWTYYFEKIEVRESNVYPTGNDISNVQEWVKYRAK